MGSLKVKHEESDVFIDESGNFTSINDSSNFELEFDIFTDEEEKKNIKKRKTKASSRKLWTQVVRPTYNVIKTYSIGRRSYRQTSREVWD